VRGKGISRTTEVNGRQSDFVYRVKYQVEGVQNVIVWYRGRHTGTVGVAWRPVQLGTSAGFASHLVMRR